MHRVTLGQQLANQRVAGLVVRRVALLFVVHHHGAALGPHHDFVFGHLEVVHIDQTLVAARGKQRRFVDQVGEVGTGHAGGAAREDVALDIGRQRHFAHMHCQNLLTATNVRQRHHHLAVKAARAQQRRIEHIGAVGRGNHDHPGAGLEAVHLDQHLIESLFTLVIAAAQARAALAAHCVNLVNENDAGGVLLGVVKHVAHTGGADADKHFHKIGTGDREKRHLGFTCNRARQQGFAGAG